MVLIRLVAMWKRRGTLFMAVFPPPVIEGFFMVLMRLVGPFLLLFLGDLGIARGVGRHGDVLLAFYAYLV